MIQINNNIRIVRRDDKNLAIEKYDLVTNSKTNESHYEWRWVGYYGDVKSALLGVLKHSLLDGAEEELDIQGLIKKIKIIEQEILSLNIKGEEK